MHTQNLATCRDRALIALLLSTLSFVFSSSTAAQTVSTTGSWVLTTPKRRAMEAPPAMPPELPVNAGTVSPTTISIVVRRKGQSAASRRQTVSRTAERIHLTDGSAREWLFERNSVDPRRASGMLVDHSAKAIILYEETDLRMSLGIRGWADILTLGFASDSLALFKRTNETRVVGGVRFTRLAAPRDRAGDVWWSDEEALASTFSTAIGSVVTQYTVTSIKKDVDEPLLRPATERFPGYRVTDLAEWRER